MREAHSVCKRIFRQMFVQEHHHQGVRFRMPDSHQFLRQKRRIHQGPSKPDSFDD